MKKLSILLLLFLGSFNLFAQVSSDKALMAGVGYALSSNRESDGQGMSYQFGYQLPIGIKKRIRFIPSLTFGTFTENGFDTEFGINSYFNSTNLKLDLNFDVIKIESFSFILGTGIGGNYSTGLTIAGTSNTIRESHLTTNLLLGFRVNPPNHRLGYELNLFNASLNFMSWYAEASPFQFRVFWKYK
ncbi:hypothetical protein [Sediminitomix flava]|uniref:Outer membrane protein with beta-barrel domain n=1 Tax=Sediminitomix flava TaxID=379075 RepID=A0A315Z6W3_SEDFL|nr:hypothetical protein [Sediminitomix flava]PWJ38495.1 hypothetical protein BC781_10785 [Sediminitomix flava]